MKKQDGIPWILFDFGVVLFLSVFIRVKERFAKDVIL